MKCSRASPHSLPRTPNPDKKGKGSRPRAPKRFGWKAPRPRNPHIFAIHGPWDPLGGKCASLSFILPLYRAGLWTVLSVTAMVNAGCGMLVGYVVWGRVTAFGLQPQLSAKRMRYSVQAKVTTNCRSAQKLIFSRAPARIFCFVPACPSHSGRHFCTCAWKGTCASTPIGFCIHCREVRRNLLSRSRGECPSHSPKVTLSTQPPATHSRCRPSAPKKDPKGCH